MAIPCRPCSTRRFAARCGPSEDTSASRCILSHSISPAWQKSTLLSCAARRPALLERSGLWGCSLSIRYGRPPPFKAGQPDPCMSLKSHLRDGYRWRPKNEFRVPQRERSRTQAHRVRTPIGIGRYLPLLENGVCSLRQARAGPAVKKAPGAGPGAGCMRLTRAVRVTLTRMGAWCGGYAFFFRLMNRRVTNPAKPIPSSVMLAGSGTTSTP